MNNPDDSMICKRHQQRIVYYSPSDKAPFCSLCVLEKAGVIPYDQLLNEQLKTGNNEFDGLQQQLEQFANQLLTHKQDIIQKIDNILQMIMEQIKLIQPQKEIYQNKFQQKVHKQQIQDFEKELNSIQQRKKQVFQDLEQQLQQLQKQFNNIDDMVEMLKYTPKQIEYETFIISNKIASQEEKNKEKEFEYELIKELIKSEKNSCKAFAFNNDNTILLVGCQSEIICYDLQNLKLNKELQRLQNPDNYAVDFLHFMKQQQEFVSGSYKSIFIWGINENNQWFVKQELEAYEFNLNSLLINNQEDLMVSFKYIMDQSYDEPYIDGSEIQFWRKMKDSWSCQQTINTGEYLYALSFNEEGSKLIISGYRWGISIYEQQKDQKWISVQQIEVIQYGRMLCFTKGNQFVFQPNTLDYLEVYEYDNLKKQFCKIARVQVQKCEDCSEYFPCQFIKQLDILMVKHGNFLNIFKVQQNGNYKLVQTIKLGYSIYGKMSDDGQYLITQDKISLEIRVRKLKFNYN